MPERGDHRSRLMASMSRRASQLPTRECGSMSARAIAAVTPTAGRCAPGRAPARTRPAARSQMIRGRWGKTPTEHRQIAQGQQHRGPAGRLGQAQRGVLLDEARQRHGEGMQPHPWQVETVGVDEGGSSQRH